MAQHICGKCSEAFASEQEYNSHICKQTGFTPADPRSMPNHEAISKAALARGEKRKADESK